MIFKIYHILFLSNPRYIFFRFSLLLSITHNFSDMCFPVYTQDSFKKLIVKHFVLIYALKITEHPKDYDYWITSN